MRQERRTGPIQQVTTFLGDRANQAGLTDFIAHKAVDLLVPRAKELTIATDITYPDQFMENAYALVNQGVRLLFVFEPHEDHTDALAVAKLADKVTTEINTQQEKDGKEERFPGVKIAFAQSVGSGAQGRFLQDMLDKLTPHFHAHHLYPFGVVRAKDIRNYKMKSNKDEYDDEVRTGLQEGYAIGSFPSGGVKAGRKDKNGEIFGMQPFHPTALSNIIEIADDLGLPLAIVPVSVHGGYNILNKSRKFPLPTKGALFASFGRGDHHFFEMRVAQPKLLSEIYAKLEAQHRPTTPAELNDYIAMQIAPMTPEEAQGVFRERVEQQKSGVIYEIK